jgi:hypothetical protein
MIFGKWDERYGVRSEPRPPLTAANHVNNSIPEQKKQVAAAEQPGGVEI